MRVGRLFAIIAIFLGIDAAFYVTVILKDIFAVTPNEPYIQREYIEKHMAATLQGYRLEEVETIDWRIPDAPLSADDILNSRTFQNAPLLPGYVAYLEEKSPDLQQSARYGITGNNIVYGPMLEFYQQQRGARTASNVQVRQPLYTSSVARWKPYAKYLREAADRLGIAI